MRTALYLALFIFLLVTSFYFAVQLPSVQNWGIQKATSYFQKEWNTNVEIKGFRLSFRDFLLLDGVRIEDQGGNLILSAGEIKATFDQNIFSLLRNRLSLIEVSIHDVEFFIERIDDQFNFSFILDYFKKEEKKKEPKSIDLKVERILLSKIAFKLDDHDRQLFLEAYLKHTFLAIESVDITQTHFVLSKADILQPEIQLTLRNIFSAEKSKTEDISTSAPSISPNENGFQIICQQLMLNEGSFQLNNYRRHQQRRQAVNAIDYDFLTLSSLNIHLEDASYRTFDIASNICHLSFQTDAGFILDELQATSFTMNNEELFLDNLWIKTPHSRVGNKIHFSYESLDDFGYFEDRVYMTADIQRSQFATQDLFYFAGELRQNPFFKQNAYSKVDLHGNVFGTVNSLKGQNIDIVLAGKSQYRGNFSTRYLTEPSKSILNLDAKSLTTSVSDLKKLLPGFNLPKHFERLGKIEFRGRFDGYYDDFVTYGSIYSALGRAKTDIQLNIRDGIEGAKYKGKLNLSNFHVGKFLELEDFGEISFEAQVNNGTGLILDFIEADITAKVNKIEFKGYTYEKIAFDGKLVKNLLDGAVAVSDENVDLDFSGSIDFRDSIPYFDFTSSIRLLDLYQIKLVDRPLSLSGDFDLELFIKSMSEIDGFADIRDLVVAVKSGDYLYADRIYLDSRFLNSPEKIVSLNSDMVDFELRGEFDIAALIPTLSHLLAVKHPNLGEKLGFRRYPIKSIKDNDFFFNLVVKETKNINQLLGIPVKSFDGLIFRGSFMNADTLNFHYRVNELSIPSFSGFDIKLDSLFLFTSGIGDESQAIFNAHSFTYSGVQVNDLDGLMELRGDTLNFNLGGQNMLRAFSDIGINGQLFNVEDRLHIRFDNLEFNALDRRWVIAEKNFLQFKKDFLYARNIRFTDGVGFVSFSTDSERKTQISGDKIDLSLLDKILKEEGISLKGTSSFQFFTDDYLVFNQLRGFASVKDFSFNNIKLGDAKLVANQDNLQSATRINLNIGESGRDLIGQGYFKMPGIELESKDELRYSFDFFMNRFPIKPAEFFLEGLISETKGFFSGSFFIEGDSSIRNVGGTLNLLDASTKIDYLGVTYSVKDSEISINNDFIDLNKVELEDMLRNKATMRGGIRHRKLRDFVTNFRINSPAITVLNTRKDENDLFFGRALGRVDATFNGPFDALDLYVNATTGPGTVVAIPLTSAKEIKEQNFIVFVSKDKSKATETSSRSTGGLALQMDLSITPEAQLQLVFDERTGDIVKGSGTGNIQLDLARSGDFQMFGEFNIEKGEYPFKVSLMDKAFKVKEGGTIVWYGDPLNAYIELEAEYKGLKTSPFNLISEYLRDEENREQARRPTEVDLTLKLQGQLLQPDIQFDIQFPQLTGELRNYTENKLRTLASDQNEINNLAFQLLFFKSFIPNQSDILSTQGGLGIASSTLTEWFTNQMRVFVNEYLIDTIANKVITDVDVDFGIVINTDFGQNLEELVAAGQSQFYVRPRVQMFDDRVIFDFGINNYGRLGSDNRLAGEFNVEYAFGGSRRFRTRVYSQDQPLPVSGRRTVFGAGLVYRREYNEFGDIFRWGAKKKSSKSPELPAEEALPEQAPLLPEEEESPEKGSERETER